MAKKGRARRLPTIVVDAAAASGSIDGYTIEMIDATPHLRRLLNESEVAAKRLESHVLKADGDYSSGFTVASASFHQLAKLLKDEHHFVPSSGLPQVANLSADQNAAVQQIWLAVVKIVEWFGEAYQQDELGGAIADPPHKDAERLAAAVDVLRDTLVNAGDERSAEEGQGTLDQPVVTNNSTKSATPKRRNQFAKVDALLITLPETDEKMALKLMVENKGRMSYPDFLVEMGMEAKARDKSQSARWFGSLKTRLNHKLKGTSWLFRRNKEVVELSRIKPPS